MRLQERKIKMTIEKFNECYQKICYEFNSHPDNGGTSRIASPESVMKIVRLVEHLTKECEELVKVYEMENKK